MRYTMHQRPQLPARVCAVVLSIALLPAPGFQAAARAYADGRAQPSTAAEALEQAARAQAVESFGEPARSWKVTRNADGSVTCEAPDRAHKTIARPGDQGVDVEIVQRSGSKITRKRLIRGVWLEFTLANDDYDSEKKAPPNPQSGSPAGGTGTAASPPADAPAAAAADQPPVATPLGTAQQAGINKAVDAGKKLTGDKKINDTPVNSYEIGGLVLARDVFVRQLKFYIGQLTDLSNTPQAVKDAQIQQLITDSLRLVAAHQVVTLSIFEAPDSTKGSDLLLKEAADREKRGNVADAAWLRQVANLPAGERLKIAQAHIHQLVDASPLLGIVDPEFTGLNPFLPAMLGAPKPGDVARLRTEFNNLIATGIQKANAEVARVSAFTTIKQFGEFADPQYVRVRQAVALAFGPRGAQLMSALDTLGAVAAANAQVDRLTFAVIVGGIAVLTIVAVPIAGALSATLVPGAKVVSAGVGLATATGQLVYDGYQYFYVIDPKVTNAQNAAGVLGQSNVNALADQRDAVAGQILFDVPMLALSAATFKAAIAEAQALKAKQLADANRAAALRAGAVGVDVAPIELPIVRRGLAKARSLGIPQAEIDSLTKAASYSSHGDSLAAVSAREAGKKLAQLAQIDELEAAARAAGVSAADIERITGRAAAFPSVDAYMDVATDLFRATVNQKGYSFLVNFESGLVDGKIPPDPMEILQGFFNNVLPQRVARANLPFLNNIGNKLAKLGRGELVTFTREEIGVLQNVLASDPSKLYVFLSDERAFVPLFDDATIDAARRLFGSPNRTAIATGKATLPVVPRPNVNVTVRPPMARPNLPQTGPVALFGKNNQPLLKPGDLQYLTTEQLSRIPASDLAKLQQVDNDLYNAIGKEVTKRAAMLQADRALLQAEDAANLARLAQLSTALGLTANAASSATSPTSTAAPANSAARVSSTVKVVVDPNARTVDDIAREALNAIATGTVTSTDLVNRYGPELQRLGITPEELQKAMARQRGAQLNAETGARMTVTGESPSVETAAAKPVTVIDSTTIAAVGSPRRFDQILSGVPSILSDGSITVQPKDAVQYKDDNSMDGSFLNGPIGFGQSEDGGRTWRPLQQFPFFIGGSSGCCLQRNQLGISDSATIVVPPSSPDVKKDPPNLAAALMRLFDRVLTRFWLEKPRASSRWAAPVERERPVVGRPGGAAAAAPAVIAIISSVGNLTGESFDVQLVNATTSAIRLDLDGVILEPLTVTAQQDAQRAMQAVAAKGATRASARLKAYCIEFTKAVPQPGELYRVADAPAQRQYTPLRRIVRAATRLKALGELQPDADPPTYFDAIKQWAIWTYVQRFNERTYEDAFVEHTKKNAKAAGQAWTKDAEAFVRSFAPHRWKEISRILQVAGAPVPAQ